MGKQTAGENSQRRQNGIGAPEAGSSTDKRGMTGAKQSEAVVLWTSRGGGPGNDPDAPPRF